MNNKFLVASLALACAAVTGNAFAADGKITVTGEINANTCAIETVGASTGANPVVVLPAAAASTLVAPGSYSASKSFTLKINGGAGCTLSTIKGLGFISDSNITAAGNMKNQGAASNVQVQLLDSDNAVVNLNGGVAKMDTTTGNVAMAVRYFSEEGTATVGDVKGEVQFSVSYL